MRSLDIEPGRSEPGKSEPGAVKSGRIDPDTALVEAAASGDMTAAASLVARHSDRVYAIGFRMLGDEGSAEDLTQEVFFKIWKNAAKWQPGRALFSTWLHRVTVNLCYDHLRKRREIKLDDLPDGRRDTPDPGPDAHDIMEARAMSRRVEQALLSLPERQRAAITLCHFEGFTNGEAADILETTVEAVESLLTRGRRKLRELLQSERQDLIGESEVSHD